MASPIHGAGIVWQRVFRVVSESEWNDLSIAGQIMFGLRGREEGKEKKGELEMVTSESESGSGLVLVPSCAPWATVRRPWHAWFQGSPASHMGVEPHYTRHSTVF